MDTSVSAMKNAVDSIGSTFEAYKETNDKRIAALKDGNESLAKELDAKLAKIDADVTKFSNLKSEMEKEQQFQRERIEELEARASNPKKTAVEQKKDEYKTAFMGWIRSRGQSQEHEAKMNEIARQFRNDVTIGTPGAGGYGVPEEISRMIEMLEKRFSPVRDLVKVVQTSTSDYKELVNIGGGTDQFAGSGWVGETGSRSATTTPQLREVTPTHGELYAYPQVSEWSLDDVFFNVEDWLTAEVAQSFAHNEGVAVLTGNGSSKPTGMLNTSPTSADDWASPLRNQAAYQYVSCVNSPIALDGDCLIDVIYKTHPVYRSNGTWVMNSTTTGAVRKLKDLNDQYLWAPGLANGQPNTLLGYPIRTWENLDDVGSNKYPVAFGDFKRAYVLADRVGLRITRDNVTNVGFVRFYVRRREGGIPLNNDAIKFIKTA